MNYIARVLETEIVKASHHFQGVILTGPRRSGKTTLLKHAFPQASHVLIEDADTVSRIRSDPRTFLASLKPPVILDEVQNAPEILTYIRTHMDSAPEAKGQWLMTGSQEASLMTGVTESMAGRVAVFSLLPLSVEEEPDLRLLTGGYPEVCAAPNMAETWFRSYIQTYLERDIRAVTFIRDLPTFRRFMGLLASRCGQMLNKTDIAAPLGVSVPTITQWLSILEIMGLILIVPPYYENFGKRLVKSPKLYFTDSGIAAHLVGVRDEDMLSTSPFLGVLFEGLVASEIVKHRINRGRDRGLYYFRDRQGLEVDFVVDQGNRNLLLIEAKATKTPRPDDAKAILRLANSMKAHQTASLVAHNGTSPSRGSPGLCPGVQTVSIAELHSHL